MDIQEKKAFDAYFRDKYPELYKDVFDEDGDDRAIIGYSFALSAWMEKAKAQAVPEYAEFVLVPKDKVYTYFQDDDEPENYCNEGNLDDLGDCLDGDDIISVSKCDQATISKVKMFGVWDYKQTENGAERVKFVICNTRQEAGAYVAKYLSYLGIEAQEQSHD